MSGERFDARLLDDIWLRPVGTVTTADHAAGATTLYVEVGGDLQDRDDESDEPLEVIRGYVQIVPPEVPDADPVPPFVVAYYDWDGELEEQEYVLLAAGLPVAVPAGSDVFVWDPDLDVDPTGATGEVVSEWVGPVMRDDQESDLEEDDNDTLILPDLVDTLTAADVPEGGIPVVVETLESFYGPEKAQQLDVVGDDDLYVTTVIGGDLLRDGSKTPLLVQTSEVAVMAGSQAVTAASAAATAQVTANSAEDRGTGAKESSPQTATSGPRVRMRQAGGRGFVDFIGDLGASAAAYISALVEEGRQSMVVASGGTNPSRLRLRNDESGRTADVLADVFNAFALIKGNQGLTLQQSSTILAGFDGNSNVTRVLSSTGTTVVPHNLAGGGAVHCLLRSGNGHLFHVHAGAVTGTDITFQFRYRADNQPAVNETVTFDWSIWSFQR